ncbi:glycosyltransferase family 4 protein [Dichotomicrobium thermohalophilum]|uniref:Glycosyltransferase involved in cell wall biosynthesis n=1 Tax=Dichotomicrobium thermohalophilum TaxID=933063 RepID=A0A397Q0I5_9HYPH|nr:glycosyltransferase family 4 protein [Dichotomicrobium thermohalophilum]RIA55020.1 glycosyltransferase involved in cell wall biosynthesis [Dichotomicrobium thermohalophilum]
MIAAAFAIPGDLNAPTGGYAYARRILPLLCDHGVTARHLALPGGFPFPDDAALQAAGDALAAIPASEVALVDGLAFGALPESVIARIAAPLVALVHHPLGLETGLSPEESARLIETERRALARARRVVATSETTAETLRADFDVPAERLSVAIPGTERAERAAGGGEVPHLLGVGAVVPRKGFDVLVAALAELADRPWRCTIAGSLDRDPATAAALRAQIERFGLSERITLSGALEPAALDDVYRSADIFVLPSRYEGYGMAFTEAMARGLPVVAAAAGAVPATVPPEAGVLVPPDDPAALAEALRKLLDDPAERLALSDAAFAHARGLPSWDDTARRVAEAIRETHEQ